MAILNMNAVEDLVLAEKLADKNQIQFIESDG